MISREEIKNFVVMMGSKSISEIGNIAFDYSCNSFLAGISSTSFYLVGIYQMCDKIVAVLLNMVGGTFADRVSRKKILCLAEFVSGVVCIALALMCREDSIIAGVIAVNILLAVFSAFSAPAYKSIIKECVHNDNIKNLNSAISTITMITNIIAPIISVVAYQYLALFGTLVFNGVSFLLSGFLLVFLSSFETVEATDEPAGKSPFFADMRAGIVYLWHHKRLSLAILFSAIVNFFIAGYNLLLPYSSGMFLVPNMDMYAVFLVSEAAGGLLGACVSPLIRGANNARSLFVQMAFSGCSLVLMPFMWGVSCRTLLVALGPFFFNFFLAMFNVNFYSYVHSKVEVGYLGRVFGVVFTISILFMPCGTAVFSSLLDPGFSLNYLFVGLCILMFSLVFIFLDASKRLLGISSE